MSDTEQMVRLMEHAAEGLTRAIGDLRQIDHYATASLRLGAVAAAAQARGVLQMVAASVAPEGHRLAARLREDYADWAEQNNEISMSDGELAAVARFIAGGAS